MTNARPTKTTQPTTMISMTTRPPGNGLGENARLAPWTAPSATTTATKTAVVTLGRLKFR